MIECLASKGFIEIWECFLMKLTVDQYCYVYFCIFEEPAMFKPLSYSPVLVSPCDIQLVTQALRQKNIRTGSPDVLNMSIEKNPSCK